MLVNDAATSSATTGKSGSAATAAPASSVDFQNFLRLLTTQLRYQDPTAPLDATQFVSQLASFSTVEQLVSANQRLDALAGALEGGDLQRYASWVGLRAEIGDGVVDFTGDPASLKTEAVPDAASVELVVKDASGREIDRRAVANASARLPWDGVVGGARVAPGRYSLSVDYLDADGALAESRSVAVISEISEVRVTPEGTEIGLVGGRRVPVASVIGVGK